MNIDDTQGQAAAADARITGAPRQSDLRVAAAHIREALAQPGRFRITDKPYIRLLVDAADPPPCTHAHWKWTDHGRRCTCGALMLDPGD